MGHKGLKNITCRAMFGFLFTIIMEFLPKAHCIKFAWEIGEINNQGSTESSLYWLHEHETIDGTTVSGIIIVAFSRL